MTNQVHTNVALGKVASEILTELQQDFGLNKRKTFELLVLCQRMSYQTACSILMEKPAQGRAPKKISSTGPRTPAEFISDLKYCCPQFSEQEFRDLITELETIRSLTPLEDNKDIEPAETLWGRPVIEVDDLPPVPANLFTGPEGRPIAVIDRDGIFHVKAVANDDNARQFIEILEKSLNRRLTGISVADPSVFPTSGVDTPQSPE